MAQVCSCWSSCPISTWFWFRKKKRKTTRSSGSTIRGSTRTLIRSLYVLKQINDCTFCMPWRALFQNIIQHDSSMSKRLKLFAEDTSDCKKTLNQEQFPVCAAFTRIHSSSHSFPFSTSDLDGSWCGLNSSKREMFSVSDFNTFFSAPT